MTPAQAIALIDHDALRHPPRVPHPADQNFGRPASVHWADLGCGSGVFTLALAAILPPNSTIHAIDRTPTVRRQTTQNHVSIEPIKSDFVKDDLAWQDLDGMLMANSLHYVKDKSALIQKLNRSLRPQHWFLIVEYDTDRSTPIWVPYPVSFTALTSLFRAAGYSKIEKLNTMPSAYGRSNIYAALIQAPPA